MNDNEYLGALVRGMLLGWDLAPGLARGEGRVFRAESGENEEGDVFVSVDTDPIAALEELYEACGIALPERGDGWMRVDGTENDVLPANRQKVYVTYSEDEHSERKVTTGYCCNGDWYDLEDQDEYAVCAFLPFVWAWMPCDTPEPYQEAQ